MHFISAKHARDLSMKMLTTAGIPEPDATILFESLLMPSLRGHDSHGIRGIPNVVNQAVRDPQRSHIKPTVLLETDTTIAMDAKFGLGPVIARKAVDTVVEKARKHGMAAATMYNLPGVTALGYYTELIAKQDMIGQMYTRSSIPQSPPYGGASRMLGTNPVSVAIPALTEKPIIVDMASTAIAARALSPYIAARKPIPEGWILDDDGVTTSDPTKYEAGAPMNPGKAGSMANMTNGPKGYALQLISEIFGGILGGGVMDPSPIVTGKIANDSMIMAINISAFGDLNTFKTKVDQRIRMLKSSKKAKGFDEILIPGERGFKTEEKRMKEGIPLEDNDWQEWLKAAKQFNIDVEKVLSS